MSHNIGANVFAPRSKDDSLADVVDKLIDISNSLNNKISKLNKDLKSQQDTISKLNKELSSQHDTISQLRTVVLSYDKEKKLQELGKNDAQKHIASPKRTASPKHIAFPTHNDAPNPTDSSNPTDSPKSAVGFAGGSKKRARGIVRKKKNIKKK